MNHDLYTEQEAAGYSACYAGHGIDACPYDEDADFDRWYHWRRGYAIAHAQQEDAAATLQEHA
jgi:ribosome modulation factor